MESNKIYTGIPTTPDMIEEITLGGESVRLTHKNISIGDTKLDPKNQRLQFFIASMGGSYSEEALEKRLWEIPDVKALYRSILLNQGLIERIIIQADGTVAEGNCRTICYRKLNRDYPDEPRWQSVPSRVLPADISPKLLAILLGEMHVAGKNEWTAYEQAAYVYRMNEDFGYSLDFLAEHLRSSKSTIKKMIDAYKLMSEHFLAKYPDTQNVYKYSYFEEFYKKIKTPTSELERDFVDWVGTGKLNEGVQVRDLPNIIENYSAKTALAEKGYSEAMSMLEAADPSYTSKFFYEIDRMVEHFKRVPYEDIQAVREKDKPRIEKIKTLYQALKDFAELTELNLDEKKSQ